MVDLTITIVFELLLLLVIVGTFLEWRKRERPILLLPIPAYVLGMASFLCPVVEGLSHPWLGGFLWLAVGVAGRVVVGNIAKSTEGE